MSIDTSMYKTGMQTEPTNPLENAQKLVETQYMMNKLRGGMPMTQDALGLLGAGKPYGGPNG